VVVADIVLVGPAGSPSGEVVVESTVPVGAANRTYEKLEGHMGA